MDAMRAARKARGITQKAAAEALGTTQQTYQRWETGKSEPGIAALRNISVLFDIPLARLTGMPKHLEGTFAPTLHYITGDDSGFWGHVSVTLETGWKEWWPIAANTADEIGERLARELPDDTFISIDTLNNRSLMIRQRALRQVELLIDAASEPNDGIWNGECGPLDRYEGLEPILYQQLTELALNDGSDGTSATAVANAFCEENNLSVSDLRPQVLETRFHFADGRITNFNVTDETLIWMPSQLEDGITPFFDFTDDDAPTQVFVNRATVSLLDIPQALYQRVREEHGEDIDINEVLDQLRGASTSPSENASEGDEAVTEH